MSDIGPKDILRIRQENNLTLKQFGAGIGVTAKTVSLWERGLSKPRRTHALAIYNQWAEAFDENNTAYEG